MTQDLIYVEEICWPDGCSSCDAQLSSLRWCTRMKPFGLNKPPHRVKMGFHQGGNCLRVCVFILFHREGFLRLLQDVWDILEGNGSTICCVVSIIRSAAAKFLHLSVWKCYISPPKMKTPGSRELERKRCDIHGSAKMI